MAIDPQAQSVLDFWFGERDAADFGRPRSVWFVKNAEFDLEIAQRFGVLIESALHGELAHWENEAPSALAAVIVLDQFTRNVFRDTPRAFAGDARALSLAQTIVATGQERALVPVQRAFVYLPFEHAENLVMQDESVRLFSQLASDEPGLDDMLDYAHRHRAVIARFGRFPHRNAVLGRSSSAEELAFLELPGSRF